MTRDEIIAFVYTDPEKRLERFCKSLTSGQKNGDWDELRAIVLERLCNLKHEEVVDMWRHKEGYRAQAIWIWLHNCAKTQAHGNRTTYQKIVLHPKEQFETAEYFDTVEDVEDHSSRLAFETRVEQAHEKFEERVKDFPKLLRVVLETYLRGNMNASHICRISGVPYNYYLSQIDQIRRIMEECAGMRPIARTVTPEVVFTMPSYTRCRNLIRISQQYKKINEVPYWHLLKGSFQARERKLYPQPTLFPIRQYLPMLYRKIAIA